MVIHGTGQITMAHPSIHGIVRTMVIMIHGIVHGIIPVGLTTVTLALSVITTEATGITDGADRIIIGTVHTMPEIITTDMAAVLAMAQIGIGTIIVQLRWFM